MSKAVGSPVPETEARITLGEAFASIESLSDFHGREGAPLRIAEDPDIKDYDASSGVVGVLAEIPYDLQDADDFRSALRARLRDYPQGSRLRVPANELLVKDPQGQGWVELYANVPNAPRILEDEKGWHAAADATIDDIAPLSSADGYRYLRAPIGGVILHPLMAWWVLLHGLSMFARYHPAVWRQALDVDFTADAVTLEAALEVAVDHVPALVADVLDREVPSSIRSRPEPRRAASKAQHE